MTFNSVNDYCEPPPPMAVGPEALEGEEGMDEEDDEDWSGSGSETLSEENEYECKVEVKQNQTSVPTSVRTIETKVRFIFIHQL